MAGGREGRKGQNATKSFQLLCWTTNFHAYACSVQRSDRRICTMAFGRTTRSSISSDTLGGQLLSTPCGKRGAVVHTARTLPDFETFLRRASFSLRLNFLRFGSLPSITCWGSSLGSLQDAGATQLI
eukprot:SAG31_NODE_3563_length_4120_cov_7.088286_2_plen_127_part_00